MKALRYKIRVCASALEMAHGGGHIIEEVYIPDLRLGINEESEFTVPTEEDGKARLKNAADIMEIEIGPTMELILRATAAALDTVRVSVPKLREKLFPKEDKNDGS